MLGDERCRCGHGVRDRGAAAEASRERVLLRALDRSGLPHVTFLGDTGPLRRSDSNRADLRKASPAGFIRSPSGQEVEDEVRAGDAHKRATLVAALDQDELVRLRHLTLEDALEEELVLGRKPVEETCNFGP